MDDFDTESEYNSEDDPYSERNVMSRAFEEWSNQVINGNDTLTPPYKSMDNWYKRLGIDINSDNDYDDDDDTSYGSEDENDMEDITYPITLNYDNTREVNYADDEYDENDDEYDVNDAYNNSTTNNFNK